MAAPIQASSCNGPREQSVCNDFTVVVASVHWASAPTDSSNVVILFACPYKPMNRPGLLMAVTTFAQQADATQMAQRVIRARVAACAQIEGPIHSHYLWKGQECQDTEWRLTMKTTEQALERLSQVVHSHHPYEVPQWSVFEAQGASEAYAAWVRQSVAEAGEAE